MSRQWSVVSRQWSVVSGQLIAAIRHSSFAIRHSSVALRGCPFSFFTYHLSLITFHFSRITTFGNSQFFARFWHYLSLAVIALAFWLRVRTLTLFQFHIDEFFTLTAANLIAKTGLPRYPTGLFYDPGLPFSYIDGALFWLLGFSEALGRWPAVIFSTLAVATVYRLGRRLLRSPAAGLLAALWLALSLESVEWGGRARMISLAQWLGLLAVWLLWQGLTRNSARRRLAFAASYGLTLLSHLSTVVLMPAWFVSAAGLWWARAVRLRRVLLRDTLVLLLIFGLAISSGVIFQPPPTVEYQTANEGLDTKVGLLTNKFLQIPSDLGHAWQAYGPYFLNLPHGPLLALAVVGLAATLRRLAAGRRAPRDVGALFLGCIFLTVIAVLALVISPHWQRSRYLLMQAQGIFLLLGAHGWQEIIRWLGDALPTRRPNLSGRVRGGVALILAAALSLPFLPPLANIIDSGSSGWNRYDQAFKHVRKKLSDGDKVMSMHPPASLLYLNQSDYYLVQSSPKLIVRPDGRLGDRYTGAIWLESADEFNTLLAEQNRVWLVTQEFWLFNSYNADLHQQILWQMDKKWGEGGVWALASRPDAWPLARQVDTVLNADFEGGARLLGYSATPPAPAPGAVMRLTLFWQGNVPQAAKVFVHLRDGNNATVAQADHFIYNGKVPTSRWPSLFESSDTLRDGATLALPPDLPPGTYRLVVGFYHPETFERLGVVNDQSGESAVILGEWRVE